MISARRSDPPRDTPVRERHSRCFIALLALLAWLPVPLGSHRPWAWAIMEVGVLGLFVVGAISWIREPQPLPAALRRARWPLALFISWLALFPLQFASYPAGLVNALSPTVFALQTDGVDGVPSYVALSLDGGATLVEFLKSLSYVILFFAVLVLVNSTKRARQLVKVLFLVGLCEAVYGILVFYAGDGSSFWNPVFAAESVGGTYVNRNHFAGLMELTIPLGIALMLRDLGGRVVARSWRARMRVALGFLLHRRSRRYLYIVIMIAALFLSASRGGVAAFVLALFVVTSLGLIGRGRRTEELRAARWVMLLSVVAVSWFGVDVLGTRLAATADAGLDVERVAVWRTTTRMCADFPWTGSGAGTFRWVFPAYRDGSGSALFYEHAHNDYLELIAEQGALGAVLLGGAVFAAMATNMLAFLRRRDLGARAVLFGVNVATTALLIHGLVDFNFHIPANAAYFFVLLGLGMAATSVEPAGANARFAGQGEGFGN
jgi:putative inorganic carbon (HCO3(-)) transporter